MIADFMQGLQASIKVATFTLTQLEAQLKAMQVQLAAIATEVQAAITANTPVKP